MVWPPSTTLGRSPGSCPGIGAHPLNLMLRKPNRAVLKSTCQDKLLRGRLSEDGGRKAEKWLDGRKDSTLTTAPPQQTQLGDQVHPSHHRTPGLFITSELGGEHAGSTSWVIYLKIIHIKISKVVTYWPGLPLPAWLPEASSVSLLCEQFPL